METSTGILLFLVALPFLIPLVVLIAFNGNGNRREDEREESGDDSAFLRGESMNDPASADWLLFNPVNADMPGNIWHDQWLAEQEDGD